MSCLNCYYLGRIASGFLGDVYICKVGGLLGKVVCLLIAGFSFGMRKICSYFFKICGCQFIVVTETLC